MHVDAVPNRSSRPTYLLREGCTASGKRCANARSPISALSDEQIAALRAVLAGVAMRPVDDLFAVVRSRPHGHVQAAGL